MNTTIDLIIEKKNNPGGYFFIIDPSQDILFSDRDLQCPWPNPIIFNSLGELPIPIYIRANVPFCYFIADKNNVVIGYGKFEGQYPVHPMLRHEHENTSLTDYALYFLDAMWIKGHFSTQEVQKIKENILNPDKTTIKSARMGMEDGKSYFTIYVSMEDKNESSGR